jgi:PAS domain S-box-containing protein
LELFRARPEHPPADELPPEKDNRLRLVLQAAHAGFYDLNLQTGEAGFTSEYATMLGYDPADFQLDVVRWTSWLHPEDRESTLAILANCARGEISSYDCQFRLCTRTGDWKWIQSSGKVAAWGPAGQPERLIGIHTDITERKRADEALKASQALLNASQSTAHIGGWELDLSTHQMVWTEECYRIHGRDPATFQPTFERFVEQVLPEDRAQMHAHDKETVTTKVFRPFEFRFLRPDGVVRWVHVTGRVVCDTAGVPVKFCGTQQDITERWQIAEALRKKTEELDRYFTNSLDLLCIAGTDGRFIRLNPEWEKTLGYSLAELQGRLFLELVHPEDVESTIKAVASLSAQKEILRFLNRYRCKDGTYRWLEWNSYPDGNLIYAVARDVTERKNVESALRETEGLYRTVFQTSPDGIVLLDLEGRITFASPKALQVIGVAAIEEVTGRSIDDFIAPDDHARVHAAFERVLNEQYYSSSEYTVRRPDGSSFIGEFNAALLRDVEGRPKGVLGIMRDTTARKQAEEALRSSERKLAEIFRASPGFISVSTMDEGRILEVNDAYTTLLGFERAQVIGRTAYEFNLWPTPGDRARLLNLVKEQGRISNLETRLRRKSGEIIDVLMSMAPITIEGQACLITIATDIGEHKRAEKARLEMERRLLHAQKLESLGVLAGGIAHDFNNLLMAILGNLDLALMDLSPASPARSSIEQSAIAARRAADLTRQMLAYSGKASFDVRRINLSELVEENAHLFRTCISKIVVLNVRLDRGLPLVNVDSGQIQQVIMNLITNASEAIGDRPGAISLSTGVQTCEAAALSRSRVGELPQPGRFVWLEVADTGCGMDHETQLRLFDPFFSTKLMGRGLGMSAILGIVRAHQGAIFVDSTVGQGTTIQVLFPAGETRLLGAGPGATSGNPSSQPGEKRATEGIILVVDDEDMVRNVCARILRRLGWQVITAADGPEAIKLYQKNFPTITCVILDQSMPQMDGMTVSRELHAINPGVKVILSSGYSNDQIAGQRPTAEGLAGFIQKPYTIDSLRQELARVLKRAG